MSSPENRRSEERRQFLTLPMPQIVLLDGEGQPLAGALLDVSRSGLGLALGRPVRQGAVLQFVTSDAELELEVMWARAGRDERGLFRCGCRAREAGTDLLELVRRSWSVEAF